MLSTICYITPNHLAHYLIESDASVVSDPSDSYLYMIKSNRLHKSFNISLAQNTTDHRSFGHECVPQILIDL